MCAPVHLSVLLCKRPTDLYEDKLPQRGKNGASTAGSAVLIGKGTIMEASAVPSRVQQNNEHIIAQKAQDMNLCCTFVVLGMLPM